ncbi:hypothetical protein BTA51_25135 [Hahella sp. CCB-MM4]|uniref:TonB family protein n=1 Tax=Hahella sp. (strain CCB-MM4) TaxID=1926491 RepID=UPI000BCDF9AE|nr:TonB family protein [Hahella sp. CCB-MM4]OZG70651.1 hypothetical protein BTA51_25135 [Hahella sp. CCB-MM4]
MTLSLAQGQTSIPSPSTSPVNPLPSPSKPADSSRPTDDSRDIRDNSLPWKSESTDAFHELSKQSSSKPNLSWIDNMFSHRRPQDSATGNKNQKTNDEDEIKDLLKATPSTQSEFWPYLVKHLANNKYHDKQYPFSELQNERIVVLELGFQSNGMLVRAKIARSSGDSELDAAAIRSAYAANPFEPPPSSDRAFDYNYLVQIIYSPKKPESDG